MQAKLAKVKKNTAHMEILNPSRNQVTSSFSI